MPAHNLGPIHTIIYPANPPLSEILDLSQAEYSRAIIIRLVDISASQTINSTLFTLAETAHYLWPNWYGADLSNKYNYLIDNSSTREALVTEIINLSHNIPETQLSWVKQAARIARIRPPILPKVISEIKARQLSLAIKQVFDRIILAVEPVLKTYDAIGFSKAAEWIQRETDMALTIFLPDFMAKDDFFSTLLYNAELWSNLSENPTHQDTIPVNTAPVALKPSPAPGSKPVANKASSNRKTLTDEFPRDSERIIGHPHPNSPGEQRLAIFLQNDPRFKDLFQYNQRVNISLLSRPLVDLLWPEGRLVIEIDGYSYHSNQVSFEEDRHRDYLLLISGYRVLRLTHDEIMRDPAKAVDKINDVVSFIRNNSVSG